MDAATTADIDAINELYSKLLFTVPIVENQITFFRLLSNRYGLEENSHHLASMVTISKYKNLICKIFDCLCNNIDELDECISDMKKNPYAQLAWRVHMINPQSYYKDCMKSFGTIIPFIIDENQLKQAKQQQYRYSYLWSKHSNPKFEISIDLISSVAQETKFMSKIVKTFEISQNLSNLDEKLHKSLYRYCAFLILKKKLQDATATETNNNNNLKQFILIPRLDIDLLWHSHQLYPLRYNLISQKLFNLNVLDYNSQKTNKKTVKRHKTQTKQAWNAMYKNIQNIGGYTQDSLQYPNFNPKKRNGRGESKDYNDYHDDNDNDDDDNDDGNGNYKNENGDNYDNMVVYEKGLNDTNSNSNKNKNKNKNKNNEENSIIENKKKLRKRMLKLICVIILMGLITLIVLFYHLILNRPFTQFDLYFLVAVDGICLVFVVVSLIYYICVKRCNCLSTPYQPSHSHPIPKSLTRIETTSPRTHIQMHQNNNSNKNNNNNNNNNNNSNNNKNNNNSKRNKSKKIRSKKNNLKIYSKQELANTGRARVDTTTVTSVGNTPSLYTSELGRMRINSNTQSQSQSQSQSRA